MNYYLFIFKFRYIFSYILLLNSLFWLFFLNTFILLLRFIIFIILLWFCLLVLLFYFNFLFIDFDEFTALSIQFQYHLFSLPNNLLLNDSLGFKVLLTQFNRLNQSIRFSLIILNSTQNIIILHNFGSYLIQKPRLPHQIRLHNGHKGIGTHINDNPRRPTTQERIPQYQKILTSNSNLTQ